MTKRLKSFDVVSTSSAGAAVAPQREAPAISHDDVANNETKNGKMLGGITGKGWKPGQSGNPTGRPKKKPITEIWDEIVESPKHRDEIKKAALAIINARDGVTVSMLKEMADRIEGKSSPDSEGFGNLAIQIQVEFLA